VSTENTENTGPGPHERETAHVERATINITEADIENTPASRKQARALAYAVCVLFVVGIAIGAANLLFTSSQVHQVKKNSDGLEKALALEQKQIRADCGFYLHLSGLPVTDPPGPGDPSRLGVQIISDSRASFTGHGCPGHLPAPDASFVKWAGFYHLPVFPDGS
jgi:hypothetical protein